MKYLVVDVTEIDIVMGQPFDNTACPVARAVRRKPGYEQARIGGLWWYPTGRTIGHVKIRVSKRLNAWVRAFDRGADVEPARFRLRLP